MQFPFFFCTGINQFFKKLSLITLSISNINTISGKLCKGLRFRLWSSIIFPNTSEAIFVFVTLPNLLKFARDTFKVQFLYDLYNRSVSVFRFQSHWKSLKVEELRSDYVFSNNFPFNLPYYIWVESRKVLYIWCTNYRNVFIRKMI